MLKCWNTLGNSLDIPSICTHQTIAAYLQNWRHNKIRMIARYQALYFVYVLKLDKMTVIFSVLVQMNNVNQ